MIDIIPSLKMDWLLPHRDHKQTSKVRKGGVVNASEKMPECLLYKLSMECGNAIQSQTAGPIYADSP